MQPVEVKHYSYWCGDKDNGHWVCQCVCSARRAKGTCPFKQCVKFAESPPCVTLQSTLEPKKFSKRARKVLMALPLFALLGGCMTTTAHYGHHGYEPFSVRGIKIEADRNRREFMSNPIPIPPSFVRPDLRRTR